MGNFDIDLVRGGALQNTLARVLNTIGGPRLEVKADFKAIGTGNFAVEYEQRLQSGEIVPSGVYAGSDWMAYGIPQNRTVLLLPTSRAKRLRDHAIRHIWTVDKNPAHCAIVPINVALLLE
jgi:hypothetical protein